jgi:hypothetical protein
VEAITLEKLLELFLCKNHPERGEKNKQLNYYFLNFQKLLSK